MEKIFFFSVDEKRKIWHYNIKFVMHSALVYYEGVINMGLFGNIQNDWRTVEKQHRKAVQQSCGGEMLSNDALQLNDNGQKIATLQREYQRLLQKNNDLKNRLSKGMYDKGYLLQLESVYFLDGKEFQNRVLVHFHDEYSLLFSDNDMSLDDRDRRIKGHRLATRSILDRQNPMILRLENEVLTIQGDNAIIEFFEGVLRDKSGLTQEEIELATKSIHNQILDENMNFNPYFFEVSQRIQYEFERGILCLN